jgi:DNA-binding NarL/FixJ family response regulator
LVFMDCLMPVMDGYTAARMMRQLGYRGPILALTGNSSEADAEKAMEAGYNSTVVKPIRTDDLIAIIKKWTSSSLSGHSSSPLIAIHSSTSPSASPSLFDPISTSPATSAQAVSSTTSSHSSPHHYTHHTSISDIESTDSVETQQSKSVEKLPQAHMTSSTRISRGPLKKDLPSSLEKKKKTFSHPLASQSDTQIFESQALSYGNASSDLKKKIVKGKGKVSQGKERQSRSWEGLE